MLTKDKIFKQIRDTGYVFWKLCMPQGYNLVHVRSYNNETKKEAPVQEQIDFSIKSLDSLLSDFPANLKFSIELKSSERANGAGIIGALEFINSNENQQTVNGLGSVPQVQDYSALGYVHKDILAGQMQILSAQNDLQLQKLMQEFENKLKIAEFERKEEKLKEKEKDLKDKESEFNNKAGLLGAAFWEAGKKAIGMFSPQLAALANTDLSGSEIQQTTENKTTDDKEKVIEKFSNELFNSPLTAEETKQVIENFKQSIQSQQTQ